MAKKKAAKAATKPKRELTAQQIASRQLKAADQAARAGWYLVTDPKNFLFAVNPHYSAEVWTWYSKLLVWRRKGEPDRANLFLAGPPAVWKVEHEISGELVSTRVVAEDAGEAVRLAYFNTGGVFCRGLLVRVTRLPKALK